MNRRHFLTAAGLVPVVCAFPDLAAAEPRTFAPAVGPWRSFEVTTRVDILGAGADTQAWVPVPNVNSAWQVSQESVWSGNAASVRLHADRDSDAMMIHAKWPADEAAPRLEVVSRIRTRDRRVDWQAADRQGATRGELRQSLRPTKLIPTDGIVLATAREATRGKNSDVAKVRALYDWVVENTYREPTVRGCGVGDIRFMLETSNLGGKCADLNALFVGLCRSVGIPARDLYGVRVAKSKFPYKELGAASADISKAQHCRSDVWLTQYGWVAVDPADVAKVMRQETGEWIKSAKHEIVAPVYSGLFGAWEGNWMAYNTAHDVKLPDSTGPALPFLMYPQAEVKRARVDSLDPDTFRYSIVARETSA